MDFDKYLEKARKQDKKALEKNGGKNYVGSASASYAKPVKSTSKSASKINNNKGTDKKPKVSGSRKQLTKEVKDDLQKAQGTYAVPKFMRNASEALIDNSIGGTVYAIAKGEKLSDSNKSKYYKEQHSGTSAELGKMFGQGVAFASQMAFGSPATSKAAKAVAGTKLGKSLATKVGTTALGKKLGEKGVQSLVQGATKGLIEDATIGLGQNIGMARAEGLKGKDLAKDVALNTGADILLGGAIESAPFISNAVKNTKLYKNAESRRALKEGAEKVAKQTDVQAPIKAAKSTATPTKLIEPNNLSTNAENTLKTKTRGSATDTIKKSTGITDFADEQRASTITKDLERKAKAGNLSDAEKIEAFDELVSMGNKGSKKFIDIASEDDLDNAFDSFNRHLEESKLNNGTLANDDIHLNPERPELKPNGADVLQERQSMKEIREKYGTMDDGTTPKATQMGKVSQTAKTISNSPLMDSPERQKLLDEAIKDGDYWQPTVSNKKAFAQAGENIANNFEQTSDTFFTKARGGVQAKSVDIFTGYQLARKYFDEGDFDMGESVLAEIAQMESETGRTLQAMRIFNSLSPEGRVKSVLKMADKLGVSKNVDIKVDDDLLKQLYNAIDESEILSVNKKIRTQIWNQIPANFTDKINSWRYLSMLGNPRTHIRNIVGNTIYLPARIMSDALAAGLEKGFSKRISELGGTKTKAFVGFKGEDKALRTKAKEEFKKFYEALADGGKYNEEIRDFDAQVFKTKWLEKLRKGSGGALEAEDKLFMGTNFESAFAQYCKANGKTVSDLTDDFIKEATGYAADQALKATYRDFSKLANAINRFRKNTRIAKDDDFVSKVGKAGATLVMDATIPFTKTPINILKRGVEYSPIGLMNGLYKVCSAKDGDTLVKGIESLAQGITGTGLVALGMWAANKGYVNGSLGDYDTETQYEQMLGSQNYALNVGDKSITLDWAAPLSMPFFVGVEAAKGMEGFDIYKAIESLESIAEPVFEMSMLSGVDNVFNTAFSDSNSVVEVFKNSVENYLSQFVPTLAGQIARTSTKDRRIALSTAETDTQRRLEKTGQKIANKIPGLTDLNQPYVDMWGRTDSKKNSKDYLSQGLENFLSPAYVSEKNITPVDKELLRLEEQTGNLKELLPPNHNNQYDVTFNKQKYRLTESQLTQYKKTRGKEAYSQLNKLINSKEYKNMTTSEKTKAIKGVYSDATDKAVKEYLLNSKRVTPESYARSTLSDTEIKNTQTSGASVLKVAQAKETLKEKNATKSLEKAYYASEKYDYKTMKGLGISDRAIEQANTLRDNNVSLETYQNYVKKADKDGNGSANQDETKAYFAKSNLTRSQKAYLWKANGWVDSGNPYL